MFRLGIVLHSFLLRDLCAELKLMYLEQDSNYFLVLLSNDKLYQEKMS